MKHTLIALTLIGLAVVTLQGTPAGAQANGGSIFKVVPTPNGNKFNSSIFAASASSPTDIGRQETRRCTLTAPSGQLSPRH